MKNSNEETIIGTKTDRNLTFSDHFKTLCTKAGDDDE